MEVASAWEEGRLGTSSRMGTELIWENEEVLGSLVVKATQQFEGT